MELNESGEPATRSLSEALLGLVEALTRKVSESGPLTEETLFVGLFALLVLHGIAGGWLRGLGRLMAWIIGIASPPQPPRIDDDPGRASSGAPTPEYWKRWQETAAMPLAKAVFPVGVRIPRFRPGRLIEIGLPTTWAELAVSAVLILAFLPMLFGGLSRARLGTALPGVLLCLFFLARYRLRGKRLRIDFRDRSHRIDFLAKRRTEEGFPEILLNTVAEAEGWRSDLVIARRRVVSHRSLTSAERSQADLPPFAAALGHEMRRPVELGDDGCLTTETAAP